ncbi:sarcosine oxidase subunit gamma [Tsukamurella sp. 1534]|uniref:sarcosine oxidase subunit gamma n=1 Tax=Tsukamurella sp. 1534 TaxID=1151061 RepID=UPI00031F5A57|nr:sarcosine oxidase subunit gamma family protein [Tsukamurella sp. 1534]
MADHPTPPAPASALGPVSPLLPAAPAALVEEVPAAMVSLRARDGAVPAAEAALASPLPGPGRATRSGDRVAVWLGPDEWLVIDRSANGRACAADLAVAIPGDAGAVIDVTSHRTVLRLRAPWARDVLASGCSIDLHPRVFGPGSAVHTTLALTGAILIAEPEPELEPEAEPESGSGTATDDVTILVRATFARYLLDWLADAAVEHLAFPDTARAG